MISTRLVPVPSIYEPYPKCFKTLLKQALTRVWELSHLFDYKNYFDNIRKI